MTSKQKLAYLAGLVDGEGSIGIAANSRAGRATFVRLLVTGTDGTLAKWLVLHFGGDITWKRHRTDKDWKPEFIWRMAHCRAIDLIAELEPFLIIKWPQANLALAHRAVRELGTKISCGYRKGWRYSEETTTALAFIRDAMKLFNVRGCLAPDPWKFIASAIP